MRTHIFEITYRNFGFPEKLTEKSGIIAKNTHWLEAEKRVTASFSKLNRTIVEIKYTDIE